MAVGAGEAGNAPGGVLEELEAIAGVGGSEGERALREPAGLLAIGNEDQRALAHLHGAGHGEDLLDGGVGAPLRQVAPGEALRPLGEIAARRRQRRGLRVGQEALEDQPRQRLR